MSTENSVSQAQKMFGEWQSAATEQVGRVVDFWTQVGRSGNQLGAGFEGAKLLRDSLDQLSQIAKKNVETSQAWASEVAKLSRESLSQAAEMGTALQRAQLEALKKTTEMLSRTPGN